jgi:hypothetical protein
MRRLLPRAHLPSVRAPALRSTLTSAGHHPSLPSCRSSHSRLRPADRRSRRQSRARRASPRLSAKPLRVVGPGPRAHRTARPNVSTESRRVGTRGRARTAWRYASRSWPPDRATSERRASPTTGAPAVHHRRSCA